jgi:hypothetical protein
MCNFPKNTGYSYEKGEHNNIINLALLPGQGDSHCPSRNALCVTRDQEAKT